MLLIAIPVFGNGDNQQNRSSEKTPLELFYGMADWYDDRDTFSDPVLDNIPGLLHKELYFGVCDAEDSIRYPLSVGIYLDEMFPSDAVRNNVLLRMDSIISQLYSVIDNNERSFDFSLIKSGGEYLDMWQSFFDFRYGKNADVTEYASNFPLVPGIRLCIVVHQVASEENYATYLMESTADYHISNGCPSAADYITYDIHSGKELSIDEILKIYPVSNLEEKLRQAYEKAAKEKDFEPKDYLTGENLLQGADGAAIINEGLLIYFKPYEIGSGAEGQYNLIINE